MSFEQQFFSALSTGLLIVIGIVAGGRILRAVN
jgi:hypothetical protein